ncbi:MAG: hypothetical protein BWY54_00633 [Candidatus Dependentiae bacterium ADurb.Bin331]|nr:MAG: hypothetical protein BWY54_00633 [Candidatus Dependentiae bacterium ADurb.Bin331]
MRLFLFLSLIIIGHSAFCMDQSGKNNINSAKELVEKYGKLIFSHQNQINHFTPQQMKKIIRERDCFVVPLSFDDIPHDVRNIILNEYQKNGARIAPIWDKEKQQLTIMTFAPDKAKETPIINDPQALEKFNARLTNDVQTGALLTEQQFNNIKDVHYAVWSNKPFHSKFFGAPIDKRKEEMNNCHMQKSHADIKSVRRLEKTRGHYLIEFNLYFSMQQNGKTGILSAEDTKQLALYDSVSKKTTYLGCPDPSWKNFDSVKSVNVEPILATKLFRKTLQEIDTKNNK